MLPAAEIAALLGHHCSVRNDAAYITAEPFSMGFTLTRYLREELLPDSPLVRIPKITALPSENGTYTVTESGLEGGRTAEVRTTPAPGFRTKEVRAAINGGEVIVNHVDKNKYIVCNIEDDAEIAVLFEREG